MALENQVTRLRQQLLVDSREMDLMERSNDQPNEKLVEHQSDADQGAPLVSLQPNESPPSSPPPYHKAILDDDIVASPCDGTRRHTDTNSCMSQGAPSRPDYGNKKNPLTTIQREVTQTTQKNTHSNCEDNDFHHSSKERKRISKGKIGLRAALNQQDIRGTPKDNH